MYKLKGAFIPMEWLSRGPLLSPSPDGGTQGRETKGHRRIERQRDTEERERKTHT